MRTWVVVRLTCGGPDAMAQAAPAHRCGVVAAQNLCIRRARRAARRRKSPRAVAQRRGIAIAYFIRGMFFGTKVKPMLQGARTGIAPMTKARIVELGGNT
jgi:hypothetical protein